MRIFSIMKKCWARLIGAGHPLYALSAVGVIILSSLLTQQQVFQTFHLVSVNSLGVEANKRSERAAVSSDGRFIAFISLADNLVSGDTNAQDDVFVRDIQSGTTERVSLDSFGNEANEQSVGTPWISADGRFVGFTSFATNLRPGDEPGTPDIFLHDRETGITEHITERGGPADFSADGRFVAFGRPAYLTPDFVSSVWVKDRMTNSVTQVDEGANSHSDYGLDMSDDGRVVAFGSRASNLVAGDTNDRPDVFVRDMTTGVIERVSVDSFGNQGNGQSGFCAISPDGRYVAFESFSNNLVPDGNPGLFIHDRLSSSTRRIGSSSSSTPSFSPSGDLVFQSPDGNLVPDDTNGAVDIFIYDVITEVYERIDVRLADPAALQGGGADVSPDDRFVAFTMVKRNEDPNGTDFLSKIFRYDREPFTYDFDGFHQPVENLPVMNEVKAGRAIPVKFSLGGDQGMNIFAAGFPRTEPFNCANPILVNGIEETVSAGSSSLSYNAATQMYTYVWKTDNAWELTCRQLVVKLADGSIHRANFKFKKN